MNKFIIDSERNIDLKEFDSEDVCGLSKESVKEEYIHLQEKFKLLQDIFYASKKYAMLVVLQGMDCSGKDGTVKKLLGDVNPSGFRVESFKEPNREELSHDYLWRVHKVTPEKGMITVFNRSYYEDVLVTRVHGNINEKTAIQRFEHINNFERFLVDNNTIVIKFFLHISKSFQKEKLKDRLERPEKHWKFSASDLVERKHWDEYKRCYEDVLSNCSTREAPWHIVPSNKRWFRNYFILKTVVNSMGCLNLEFPPIEENVKKLIDEVRKSN